jgi:hypothetical protein
VSSKPAHRFVSLNELEVLSKQNPTTYLVEGFLPADEVHVAVGDSGLGKTPWAYQLGLCVATGKPFLGYRTHQGRVLYLDLENGRDDVKEIADVGVNPTTGEFWRFWSDSKGFDKTKWFPAFREERLRRGMTLEVGPSRRNIETAILAAHPTHCLDTNVYGIASREAKDLSRSDKRTDAFKFLLLTVKPKALLVHGRDAQQVMAQILGVETLSETSFAPIAIETSRKIMVRAVRHARFWQHPEAERYGRELRDVLG